VIGLGFSANTIRAAKREKEIYDVVAGARSAMTGTMTAGPA